MDPEHDPRLYIRIRAQLATKIRNGQYPAGTGLPTNHGIFA
jgi:DNA-binding GntR family transcriptional regulator